MTKHEKQKINHCSDPASFLCLSSCFALSSNDYLFALVCEFFKGHQRTAREKEVKNEKHMHVRAHEGQITEALVTEELQYSEYEEAINRSNK